MHHLITSASAVLIVLGLIACGGSGQPGFTAGTFGPGNVPTQPSDFSKVRPSQEMANETATLVARKYRDQYADPECVPADSLDGSGEFNFDCTAEDLWREERRKIDVVVMGTESGEPRLGPVLGYVANPRVYSRRP